ncbi:MAG: SLBB domain-containing protein [Synergistaceae bacterium]|nr:SLBB domain-containing protein [Synergistaceae bacterium]
MYSASADTLVTSLLDRVRDAGVVGAGGAGFPTHIKLDCKVEVLLVNAAECEPLLATDKYLLNTHPDEIVEAASAVAKHVSANKIHIAIKAVNEKEIASVRGAIAHLGSSVEIFPLDNYYPAGDEQMIVYDVTGRVVPPSGIPLDVGVVVSNSSTMWNIYHALSGRPVTHKFLTVAGEVARPTVLKVPVGTSFSECLNACGGSGLARFKIIDGGPMMGTVLNDSEINSEINPGRNSERNSAINSKCVTKTTSGIIVIPASGNFDACTHDTATRKMLNRAKSACVQCSFCTELCPRHLIGHPLRPHRIMRCMAAMDFAAENPVLESPALETLKEALICSECGVCETFACPMGLSPRQVNKYVKKLLAGVRHAKNANEKKHEAPLVPDEMRKHRKIAPPKIMARMGLQSLYEKKAEGFVELSPDRVRIPVKQHIGAPARPLVNVGDRVSLGQLIAEADGRVSANVHASIDGVVVEVGSVIEITKRGA